MKTRTFAHDIINAEAAIKLGNNQTPHQVGGLTKREYMATIALAGLLANTSNRAFVAPKAAVELADELIVELNKEIV